ncbi:MAG TPA: hypothetical protein VJ998_03445 [Pseudomonadales bacterium]|nr:hypothetical protein [Pseudomonadales bacterium]
MTRFCIGLLAGVVFSIAAAADDDVSIAQYIAKMSKQDHFEVVGMEMIGRDTFTLPKKQLSPDRRLGRALAGYNYIVNYSGDRIIRVTILGRKGDSVGDLPDDASPPMEMPAPRAETIPEAVSEDQ